MTLTIQNISKSYGTNLALSGFTATLDAGIYALLGPNGSGKSTVLNVIAEKLKLGRTAPFNNSPIIDDYLNFCDYRLSYGTPYLPDGSSIITSDGVFDYLLDIRAINEGIDRRREELLREYDATVKSDWQMKSLDDYELLKKHNEAKRMTKSAFTAKRLGKHALSLC